MNKRGLNAAGKWRAIASLIALAVLLLIVAGTPHTFTLGILLGVSGLLLIFRPGVFRIGMGAERFNLLLLVIPLVSLLPIFVLPGFQWREMALQEADLNLGPLLAVNPLRVWEGALLLFAILTWSYFVTSRPIDAAGRRWLLLYISFIGAILGMIAVIGNLITPLRFGSVVNGVFSPLTDPGLFGSLIAGCAVIAFGGMVEGLKRRQLPQMIHTAFLGVAFAGLYFLGSPTAFGLFFFGVSGWLVMRIFQSSAHFLTKIFSAVLIPGGLIYGLAEFGFLEALHGEYIASGGFSMLAAMLREAPLAGFGLMNAEAWANVFVHPDFTGEPIAPRILGTWLVETGLVGLALGLLGAVVFIRRTRLLRHASEGIHQQVAAVGVGIIWLGWLLRGNLQDAAYLFFAATLTAVAFVYQRSGRERHISSIDGRPALSPWRVRTAAVVCCLLSGIYLFTTITGLKLQDAQLVAGVKDEIAITELTQGGFDNFRSELPELYDNLIQRRPLVSAFHAERGVVTLRTGGDPDSAREDFTRARFLTPDDSDLLLREAQVWTDYQPAASIEAWDRLLQRSLARGDNRTLITHYRKLLENWGNPSLDRLIQQYARQQPVLFSDYLIAVPDSVFIEEIGTMIGEERLAAYAPEEKRNFALRAFIARQNEMADQIVQSMPEDSPTTWQTRELLRFQRGDFAGATRTALDQFGDASALPDVEFDEVGKRLEAFERIYNSDRQDRMEAGKAVVAYFIHRDFISEARRLTRRMMERNEAPDFAVYWLASYFYQLEDYVDAWRTLSYAFPYLEMPDRSDLTTFN